VNEGRNKGQEFSAYILVTRTVLNCSVNSESAGIVLNLPKYSSCPTPDIMLSYT
jgi:hypothetical protein